MKVCSLCPTVIRPGDKYWYCCANRDYKFCRNCQQTKKCNNCKQKPSVIETLKVCRMCDTEEQLMPGQCNCGPICRSCSITNNICNICRKPTTSSTFIPTTTTSYMTSPPTSNKKAICPKCERAQLNCICQTNISPASSTRPEAMAYSQVVQQKQQIPPATSTINQQPMTKTMPVRKLPPLEECQNCYVKKPEDQMYCNMCGHFFCQQCLSKEGFKSICNTCRQPINQEALNMFLGIAPCILCQKPLPADKSKCNGPDKNVCENCFIMYNIDINVQSPTMVSSSPPSFSKPLGSQNNTQNGPVQLKPVPIDPKSNGRLLKPDTIPQKRVDLVEKTPEKPPKSTTSIVTPNVNKSPASIQNSPAPDRRKFNPLYASMDNQTVLECASCTIPYQISTLVIIPCKGNQHRMCRYCAIKARNKECMICKKSQDGYLDKYFCYREPTAEDRQNYGGRLSDRGLALCGTCNIIVPSGKLWQQRGRRECRTCIIKTK